MTQSSKETDERAALHEMRHNLEILRCLAAERIGKSRIVFERHFSLPAGQISNFTVFSPDTSVRERTKKFFDAALPLVGVRVNKSSRNGFHYMLRSMQVPAASEIFEMNSLVGHLLPEPQQELAHA